MERKKILSFDNIAKRGSFAKALQASFRTQPALTLQIKSLEKELGCQLISAGFEGAQIFKDQRDEVVDLTPK